MDFCNANIPLVFSAGKIYTRVRPAENSVSILLHVSSLCYVMLPKQSYPKDSTETLWAPDRH